MLTSIRTGRTVTMSSSAFFTIKKQQKIFIFSLEKKKKMEIRNIKDVKKYWYTKSKVTIQNKI